LKMFQLVGSYTEFTNINKVREQLKKHPNFWQIIKFPKPPDWLYQKYLAVREQNIYDDANVLANISKLDIYNALLVLSLRDIMMHDSTLTMNRILLHIKNEYDMLMTKAQLYNSIEDAKQLIQKIKESALNINDISEEGVQSPAIQPVREEELAPVIEEDEETKQSSFNEKDLL